MCDKNRLQAQILTALKEKRVLKQCPYGTILENSTFFDKKGTILVPLCHQNKVVLSGVQCTFSSIFIDTAFAIISELPIMAFDMVWAAGCRSDGVPGAPECHP